MHQWVVLGLHKGHIKYQVVLNVLTESTAWQGTYRSEVSTCLLYTSDAADDMQCVDLGGRRIIKK